MGLVSVEPTSAEAAAGLMLDLCQTLSSKPRPNGPVGVRLNWLQKRLVSYFGTSATDMASLADVASAFKAQAVVAAGPDAPQMLSQVTGSSRAGTPRMSLPFNT